MTPPPAADVLYLVLPAGRDRAESIGHIAERLDWPRRVVEQAITDLRLAGKPICSGSEGVWVSSSPREVADQAHRLRERAIHQLLTARALRRTAERMGEPLTLWRDAA